MKIDSYAINASAERSYQKTEYTSLSARLWGLGGAVESSRTKEGDSVDLSAEALRFMQEGQQELAERAQARLAGNGSGAKPGQVGTLAAVGGSENLPQSKEELKLQMLEQFLYNLTGKKVQLRMGLNIQRSRMQMGLQGLAFGQGGNGSAVGGRITATHFQSESESVSYKAKGVVHTADGKEINVDVNLRMSREFAAYSQTSLEWGRSENCVDPLVINYGGNAASLTGEKFDFDLDSDGILDKISFAGPGSGFLALDKNGDGTINNGSELFGPGTGNGFEELRAYDRDGNGWIDENDAVFDNLRIWSKDADGNDQLFTLRQLDIGAIYLGDVATEFSLTDSANNAQGIMRSTSFFLKESGGAGTISHIDLIV